MSTPTPAPTFSPTSSPTQLLDSIYLSNFESTTMFTSLLGWLIPGLFLIGFCCFFPVVITYINNRALITEAKINEHFMQKREEYRMKSPDDIKADRSNAMKDQFMMRFGYDPEDANHSPYKGNNTNNYDSKSPSSSSMLLDSPKRNPVSKLTQQSSPQSSNNKINKNNNYYNDHFESPY